MALPFLPRYFTMQATVGGPYLCPVANPTGNLPSNLIRADENQIFSSRVKFEAEPSKTGDSRLVHIRSCYNNKYWVAQPSGWITASAYKQEEDQTNPACTLFRTTTSSGKPAFNLYSFGKSSNLINISGSNGGLSATGASWSHVFPTVNWETLLILPSQVTFRSQDLDDNYLCSRVIDRWYNYHRFESGMDLGNPIVAHQLFPTRDGNYRIWNLHFSRYWRNGNVWIWADSTTGEDFSFVKVNNHTVALLDLKTNHFCVPDSREGKWNCLRAEVPNITNQARLTIEERVLRREISNIRYRLDNTRVYQEVLEEVDHAEVKNDLTDRDALITVRFSTIESETTSWNNSVSFNYNVTTTLKATLIPLIVEGTVEAVLDFNYDYEWREEKTKQTNREATYTVAVPPLSKVRVTLLCTTASCDVPFSYLQTDLHTDGKFVSTDKDDGIFTGINSYNYYFHSTKIEY